MAVIQSYSDWFDEEGHKIVEEIMGWLDNAPDSIDVTAFTGKDLEEFAQQAAYDIWESQIGDYEDYMYEQYKDSQLFDD